MGHGYDTWRSGDEENPSKDDSFWPLWLAEDLEGVTVYTLSYEAPATGWLGTAMPLQDRAVNVRERLLAEPMLLKHPITFICHSLGGLIVKSILLDLKAREERNSDAAALLDRIKQVIFIATPHTGSRKATKLDQLRFLIWPTPIARSLIANNPSLRKLNVDYRILADDRQSQLSHQVYYETLDTPAGVIVDEASGDPGLHSEPVPIHGNHITIAKPSNRDSDLYIRVMRFLSSYPSEKGKKLSLTVLELPSIKDGQPWNIVPKLMRVAAILILGTITFKGVQALISSGSDPDSRIDIKGNVNQTGSGNVIGSDNEVTIKK